MFSVIDSLGGGIATNLLSDELAKTLVEFKDQKDVRRFIDTLHEWEIQFEQEHDGTIVTNGAFYAYIQHYRVMEKILSYVLDPFGIAVSEKDFLEDIGSKMVVIPRGKNSLCTLVER